EGVCSRAEPSLPAVPLSRPVIPTASSGGEGSVPLSATSSILSVGFGPGDGQCRFSDQYAREAVLHVSDAPQLVDSQAARGSGERLAMALIVRRRRQRRA